MPVKSTILDIRSGSPTRLSVTKRRQAMELFAEGKGYKQVAKLLHLNVYTVRDWGRDYRSGVFCAEGRRPAADDSVMAQRLKTILDLRCQGLGVEAIVKETGLAAQTVRRYLRRLLMQSVA